MSRFIVSDRHIDALVGAAIDMSGGAKLDINISMYGESVHYDNPDKLGQILVEQNYRSVNYHYRENNTPREYKHKRYGSASPLLILAICDCYDYQSDCCNDYRATEAGRIVDAIRRHFITKLQGYNDMQWHIE